MLELEVIPEHGLVSDVVEFLLGKFKKFNFWFIINSNVKLKKKKKKLNIFGGPSGGLKIRGHLDHLIK